MAAGKTSRRGLKICCAVTAIFLVLIAAVLVALSFTMLKPRDPRISLHLEGLQNIDLLMLMNTTANVTLGTVFTVENRNYASFRYKNSTAYVDFHGDLVGEALIGERNVPARGKLNVTTSVTLMTGNLVMNPHFFADLGSGSLNLTSTATLVGKTSLLKIFKKHATVYNRCNISVFVFTRSVESICETKLKM
ncbi:uncharacterized protein LOC121249315 [Juglans microcarpa x Juglans regia]|uniref:uncharacterized protein LOC121249315 n=1 Tax=Juglans microcarpa x Juglans regia TaxID=2249226 RepID=UPI001B7F3026|nr:uncharacterized protein LOC121249315 [Juglans microcarpa x Juglans regia]